MTTFEAIKLLIEEDVRCDIHGDLYGHESVAEHLAERIDALWKENEKLKAKLADIVEAYDWWQVDTYDRCQSVLDDAIRDARSVK